MLYSMHDIKLDDDHDVKVSAGGDIERANTLSGLRQIAQFRIRTAMSEWVYDPISVADIVKLIGEGNNEETGSRIEAAVIRALGGDYLFPANQVTTRVVPTSPTEVALFVDIRDLIIDDADTTSLQLQFQIDFATGHIVGII